MLSIVIAVLAGLAVCQVATFATTVYLHRTVAHRAVALRRPVDVAFRFVVWITTGLKPREWAAVHRKHHAFTDRPGDPHSPALLGWVRVQLTNPALYRRCARDPETLQRYGKDLPPDRWDRILFDHAWLGLGTGIAVLIVLLGPVWGLVAAFVHMASYLGLNSAVNAVGHHFGRRPYENSGTNPQWLALLTAGEGLHNNHHAAPTSAKLSLRRGQLDPGWYLVRLLTTSGLARIRLERVVLKPPRPSNRAA